MMTNETFTFLVAIGAVVAPISAILAAEGRDDRAQSSRWTATGGAPSHWSGVVVVCTRGDNIARIHQPPGTGTGGRLISGTNYERRPGTIGRPEGDSDDQ